MPWKTEDLQEELQSRFLRIPWVRKERLENLSALVVGVGNLGSPVAYMLHGLGVKRLYLVDRDVVEPGNLPRQMLFSISHLGRPKAVAAAHVLREKFGDCVQTEVVPMPLSIQSAEVWDETDVVFSCVDNPAARKYVLENALDRGIPLIDMGLEEKEGQFGYALFVDRRRHGEGACVDCYVDFQGGSETPGCRVASAAPYAGMLVASAGLGMYVQHLMDHAPWRNFFWLDFNSFECGFEFLKRRASCQSCNG